MRQRDDKKVPRDATVVNVGMFGSGGDSFRGLLAKELGRKILDDGLSPEGAALAIIEGIVKNAPVNAGRDPPE